MTLPDPPAEPSLRRTVRAQWEVAAAAAILLAVLGVIDVAAIGEPRLLLSFGPLLFLLAASAWRVTPARIAAWALAFVVVAVVVWDARYAGLAYPALAMALLLGIQRWRERRR